MGLSVQMEQFGIDELAQLDALSKEGKNNLSHKWSKITFRDNSSNIQFSLRPPSKNHFLNRRS
jgi:hypothetical protein